MARVYLKEIDQSTWKQAMRLDVAPEQRLFVASNLYSIAESKYYPTFVPMAIYDEAQTMVGFLMHGIETDSGEHWILRLMVDQRYQGRGYGRAALEKIIRQLKAEPGCRKVFTSYDPANVVAAKLYQSLGFKDTGRIEDDELVVCLFVKR